MRCVRGKRGSLEEHALEVVLAIVCIVLLVAGFARLWSVWKESEVEQAQQALERVEQKLSALKAGEFTRFPLEGPCAEQKECMWYLRGWSKNERGRPEKCYFNSCICICKGEKGRVARAADCQSSKTGVCREIDVESVKIHSQAFVLYAQRVDSGGNMPVSTPVYRRGEEREECTGIKFAPVLRELELRKEEQKIELTSVIREPLQLTECRE